MAEIQTRLEETTKVCMDAYKAWDAKKSEISLREDLQEAVHELRKVASRLEIEMAISERADMTDKPLPIPSHKSMRKSKGGNGDVNDNVGNGDAPQNSSPKGGARRGPRTRRQSKPQE